MKKLSRQDLMSLEQYATERARLRSEVIAHKHVRNVQVGPNMTWCFEDYTTIRYQILEMLRAERIFESNGIQGELDAYNPLIPGTTVEPIERCSGHNGTYGVKREFRDTSMKIGKPVVQRVQASGADFYASDCPMAGRQIESGLQNASPPTHPLTLLRMAYGLETTP